MRLVFQPPPHFLSVSRVGLRNEGSAGSHVVSPAGAMARVWVQVLCRDLLCGTSFLLCLDV